jgi:hypothetical protein
MRRAGTIVGVVLSALLVTAGPASAENFVIYKKGEPLEGRECTLAERLSIGAIPLADTCVVERGLHNN